MVATALQSVGLSAILFIGLCVVGIVVAWWQCVTKNHPPL